LAKLVDEDGDFLAVDVTASPIRSRSWAGGGCLICQVKSEDRSDDGTRTGRE